VGYGVTLVYRYRRWCGVFGSIVGRLVSNMTEQERAEFVSRMTDQDRAECLQRIEAELHSIIATLDDLRERYVTP
jgi:hypothetical protein